MGRKTKLTPELQAQICNVLRAGNFVNTTCEHVGITETTFYEWCRRFPQFAQATSKARADAEINLVTLVRRSAMDGDWRAAMALLEKLRPDRYGRNVTVGGDPDNPISVQVKGRVSIADLVAEGRRQAAAAAAQSAAEAESAWNPEAAQPD